MKRRILIASLVAGLAALSAVPARAHHSHSMFDTSREVTIVGTVTNFSYRNPHVFLHVHVRDGRFGGVRTPGAEDPQARVRWLSGG